MLEGLRGEDSIAELCPWTALYFDPRLNCDAVTRAVRSRIAGKDERHVLECLHRKVLSILTHTFDG